MDTNAGKPKHGPWPTLLALIVSYAVSRAIFAAIGFRYDLFREPFSSGKLVVDFGVWAALYGVAWWAFDRFFRGR